MNLALSSDEINALIHLLDDAVTRGRNRGEYVTHYTMLRGKITDQQEKAFAGILETLAAQFCAGETPTVMKLNKTHGLTYAESARLIQRAKERACIP